MRTKWNPSNDYQWMSDLPTEIRKRPLKQLVIPGSHDALTSKMTKPIDLKDQSQTQGQNISEQLFYGSRYLDLRVRCAGDGEFYGFHGPKWTDYKLSSAIEEIGNFITKYSTEVIVITVLFDENGHSGSEQRAMKWIREHLNSKLLEVDPNSSAVANGTIDEVLDGGHQVLWQGFGNTKFIYREGIYSEKAYKPKDVEQYFVNKVGAIDDTRMWIWHMTPPWQFLGDSLEAEAKKLHDYFKERFKEPSFRSHRFNIINVNYICEYGWAFDILDLNNRS